MTDWPSKDSKKQMRLNIIRHRQKLRKYLENINDTTLLQQIKLDGNELEKCNLSKIIKQEADDKKDLIEILDTSDDEISVGSHEGWSGSCPTFDEMDIESRSSDYADSTYNSSHEIMFNDLPEHENYLYDLCSSSNNSVKPKSKKKCVLKSVVIRSFEEPPKRAKIPYDRILHNAKERACRGLLAKAFHNLRINCSFLESSRRIPSKQSILIAAKKECDWLNETENNLIDEKNQWQSINIALRERIRKLQYLPDKVCYISS